MRRKRARKLRLADWRKLYLESVSWNDRILKQLGVEGREYRVDEDLRRMYDRLEAIARISEAVCAKIQPCLYNTVGRCTAHFNEEDCSVRALKRALLARPIPRPKGGA